MRAGESREKWKGKEMKWEGGGKIMVRDGGEARKEEKKSRGNKERLELRERRKKKKGNGVR